MKGKEVKGDPEQRVLCFQVALGQSLWTRGNFKTTPPPRPPPQCSHGSVLPEGVSWAGGKKLQGGEEATAEAADFISSVGVPAGNRWDPPGTGGKRIESSGFCIKG